MPSFAELLQQGTSHAWLFIPSAILLGALHGLEPGHSKTMMAAFIVAVRGTVTQAVLLGLAATVSHTAVVWGIALGGMYLWQGLDAESLEPYLQLASAVIIIGVAVWMLWRTWRDQESSEHHHDHSHADDVRHIDTGHGVMAVGIFEDQVPPRWRIHSEGGPSWDAGDVTLVTRRPDGTEQAFAFTHQGGYLESADQVPEPHAFLACVRLDRDGHTQSYDLTFAEGHAHSGEHGLDVSSAGYQDAHERAHAQDIKRKFGGRSATTGQIVMFGLTGGLIPCPASITILLLCLQLKQFVLGAVLVLCFSIGLAITLVTVGAAAALSVRHASERFSWFGGIARRAPYLSGVLIILVGVYVGYQGWHGLAGQPV